MSFEKYKDKGLSGLTNLGNTCFLNATMQVLSHTYELNNFLEMNTYKKKLNNKYDSALLLEWDELRNLLWKENCIVSPFKFVKTVQKLAKLKGQDMFTGFNQNDLPEFLIFVIDCFHNALSREVNMTINEYSEIWKIFYGIHVSILENASTGKKISITPEPFFIINLPIPLNNKCPSLIDCFDLYVEYELMDGDNSIQIEGSDEKVSAKKSISFWSLPNILVIDIKRFNTSTTTMKKNQIMIDFPLENLDLSKYIIGYDKTSYIYDLYGVCNHSGSLLGGHYTAFVKNMNNKWYHYNDTTVSEVKIEEQIKTPKAYCFFYRKQEIKK